MPHSAAAQSAPVTTPLQTVQAKAQGSSFHLPMYLLPREKREALFALYAICRVLDDAVDDAQTADAALKNIALWEARIADLFAGQTSDDPLMTALGVAHQRFHFNPKHFADMFIALRMDAEGKMLYPTRAELERYCYGVASCVGLLSMQIFGPTGEHAERFAVSLGHALQLTNMLRDVITDARIGRVYLPREWVEQAGLTPLLPPALLSQPEVLHPVYGQLAEAARARFVVADAHGQHLPARHIAPALAMRDVYAAYWNRLAARNFMPPESGKLPLGAGTKLKLFSRMGSYLAGSFRTTQL